MIAHLTGEDTITYTRSDRPPILSPPRARLRRGRSRTHAAGPAAARTCTRTALLCGSRHPLRPRATSSRPELQPPSPSAPLPTPALAAWPCSSALLRSPRAPQPERPEREAVTSVAECLMRPGRSWGRGAARAVSASSCSPRLYTLLVAAGLHGAGGRLPAQVHARRLGSKLGAACVAGHVRPACSDASTEC